MNSLELYIIRVYSDIINGNNMKDKNGIELVPGDKIIVDNSGDPKEATITDKSTWLKCVSKERGGFNAHHVESVSKGNVCYCYDKPRYGFKYWQGLESFVEKICSSKPKSSICCSNPNIITNSVLGKVFRVCRNCKEEIL